MCLAPELPEQLVALGLRRARDQGQERIRFAGAPLDLACEAGLH
jgi:hypothetical protein